MEGHFWFAALQSFIYVVFGLMCVIISYLLYSDGGNYTLGLALNDVIAAALSIGVIMYYIFKYKEINQANKQAENGEAKTKVDDLNLNVRESVMLQLGRTDKEIEEEEAEAESRRLKTS